MIGAVIGAVIILAVRRALLSAPGGAPRPSILLHGAHATGLNECKVRGLYGAQPRSRSCSKNQNPRNLRCG